MLFKTNPTSGCPTANLFTVSTMPNISALSECKNFNLAGVLANKLDTFILVPFSQSDGLISPVLAFKHQPCLSCSLHVSINISDTDAIDGNASPRNPIKLIFNKSSFGNLDVACRIIQFAK